VLRRVFRAVPPEKPREEEGIEFEVRNVVLNPTCMTFSVPDRAIFRSQRAFFPKVMGRQGVILFLFTVLGLFKGLYVAGRVCLQHLLLRDWVLFESSTQAGILTLMFFQLSVRLDNAGESPSILGACSLTILDFNSTIRNHIKIFLRRGASSRFDGQASLHSAVQSVSDSEMLSRPIRA
jgi:hypothetical protein